VNLQMDQSRSFENQRFVSELSKKGKSKFG